jgi:hypothetical protein
MKKISLFLSLGILGINSCKKVTEVKEVAVLDKQVIVDFPFDRWSTKSTNFENVPAYCYLTDFDKRDYPKVDSITFHATLSTLLLTDSVFVRLFNITDNVEIANSTLSASTNTWTGGPMAAVHTNNIYNAFPDKKITLAVQIKGKVGQNYVELDDPYLKLRRN